jgi:hypothetical protein
MNQIDMNKVDMNHVDRKMIRRPVPHPTRLWMPIVA